MRIEARWMVALGWAVLAGCGGGGDDGTTVPLAIAHGARALASQEPPGANCPTGGARIDSGIDSDGSGVLDAGEITNTQYVCNGTTGAAGAIGATGLTGLGGAIGAAGTPGLSTLVRTLAEPAGSHCASGGTKVEAGSDADANGALDASEVSSIAYVCGGAPGSDTLMSIVAEAPGANCAAGGSRVRTGLDGNRNGVLDAGEVAATRYLCNGSDGAAGSIGPVGASGAASLIAIAVEPSGSHCADGGSRITSGLDVNGNATLDLAEVTSTGYACKGAPGNVGANGSNGSNGLTTLTSSTTETPGSHCAAGGMKIISGADSSRDGTLDPGEVTATSYVCNGLAAIGWVNVTTTSVQAAADTGYVANNASQVIVTLPLSPNVGDIVRVSGAGAGGWRIAQNAGQSIVTGNLDNRETASIARDWRVSSAPQADWRGVASSADGQRLVAVASYRSIQRSADGGLTWTATEFARPWTGVATSADGRWAVASGYSEFLYVSSNYGTDWGQRENPRQWQAVAISSDGHAMAAVENGWVWVSTDYGNNWVPRGTGRAWKTIAMSADGSRIVAAANPGPIDVSWDGGISWASDGTNRAWTGVTMSADGLKLAAVGDNEQIYTSSDSGVTWSAHENARQWSAVTSSADGSLLVATTVIDTVFQQPYIAYSSSDQGLTWTPRGPSDAILAVASSADGSRIVALGTYAYGTGSVYLSSAATAAATSTGTAGAIVGRQFQAIELQCIGANRFLVLDSIGTAFEVQ